MMFTLVQDHPPPQPQPFATAPATVERAGAQSNMGETGKEGGLDVVDPSFYRSFCFRGEGRCNFVISAKEADGEEVRIVWRLAKHRKTNTVSTKPKCHVVNAYLDQLISPFLSESYLIKAKIVYIPSDKLHYLAKIPSLPHNLKLERWEELRDEEKYPPEMSFFPVARGQRKKYPLVPKYVCALAMLDATRIPRQLLPTPFIYGPTITVEIKPKQGFYQVHRGVNLPYCQNCILQIEKWQSAAFEQMYGFCPLDLYSGDRTRMMIALDSLIRDPHRNLRIFADGNVVHDELSMLPFRELDAVLFPTLGVNQTSPQTFTSVIACILAGIDDDSTEDFQLREGSVLADLLKAQRIDTIGIVRAHEYYCKLPANIQRELKNKSNLLNRMGAHFLHRTDPRSLLERYLLAATMKDCSLMLSFRLVDPREGVERCIYEGSGGSSSSSTDRHRTKPIRIKAVAGSGYLHFAHSIRIVDLDPKTAKNLENSYHRFMAGVKVIEEHPHIHQPCRIPPITATTLCDF